jgi:hypothetical protein
MALVFQAVADESERGNQTGLFLFGGWVAPLSDWEETITPLWEERVLNGRPTLPYLHATELLSREGRAKYGITKRQAEARIDKAINVIRQAPQGLSVAMTYFDGDHFRDVFKNSQVIRPGKQPGLYQFEPDYIGFNGFAIGALEYVSQKHPEAEKVDFLVEKKQGVTHRMENFYDALPDALRARGLARLIPLIGAFISGDKERVPCQVADLLLWYARTVKGERSTAIDRRRFQRLTKGRAGAVNTMPNEDMERLDAKSKARNIPSPFTPKPKRQAS